MRLEGRKSIVTGGGAGIGEAIARAFVREGARVAVADVDQESGQAVADALRSEGATAHYVKADVSDSAAVKSMVEEAAGLLDGLDTLVPFQSEYDG